MAELWLARDTQFVVFDVKQQKEILDCPKFDSEVVINLSEEDYIDYTYTLAKFYKWQHKLEQMYTAGSDRRTPAS